MAAYALPVLAALLTWWLSTGLILLLQRLPREQRRWGLLGASLVACLAFYGLVATRGETSSGAAYLGFLSALALWGWHELTFLQGLITGPRRAACPEGAGLGRRFKLAAETLLYHELALAATLVMVALVTWGEANQFGLWTFLLLFCLRLSAKLNIFLGVPHLTEEFLPPHLDFLKTYFGRRPMNALFPVSVTLGCLAAAYVFHLAFVPQAGPLATTGNMLIATLIALGTLEHWLLVLPLADSVLWRWALGDTEGRDTEGRDTEGRESRLTRLFYQADGGPRKSNTEGTPIPAVPSEGRVT